MKNLADKIKKGELVAVPTETVYGLAGNGLDVSAVKKIYELKGRPEIKPLSLMVHDATWIDRYCLEVPDSAYFLAQKYWPGPLSIVLKSKDIVPSIVRAGGDTVSLRCPQNDLTLNLLKTVDCPLAAPSANPSGYPSPKSAEEVKAYFGDKVDIIDGGVCNLGIESTIIDLSSTPYKVIREAAIKESELLCALTDNLYVVGITGQSGAGKSAALDFLNENGFAIIDCDKVYNNLLKSDNELLLELESSFPDAFEENKLDKRKLANIVFSDEKRLQELNNITHKYVIDNVKHQITQYSLYGFKNVVIEAVELLSSGLGCLCDKLIAITASEIVRIERIMARDSISFNEAKSRIAAQKTEEYYINKCDTVISNNESLDIFLSKIYKEVLYERTSR